MGNQARMTRADLTDAVQSIEARAEASDELKHLLRELQRHQLELEMQNEELQQAQQALEESRNRYMELYDFAPMACVSLNERACIQDLNLTGAALLGQDRKYLQSLPFTPFVAPSDVSRFLLHVRRCIAGETLSTELRLHIKGRQLEVRLHSAPLEDVRSHERMCRTAILDITELRQMQARLSLAERLATVGTIAAGIGHEINNPLAFLMGNLRLAARAPPEQALAALADAQVGAERIQDIVKDLGTFARPTEPLIDRCSVQQVLELSLKMAMIEIRHRAEVVRDYEEVPEIRADRARLSQIFLNLLVNAAQSIPEGAAHSNEIRLSIRATGQSVLVQVQDTGEGMSADTLEHLFDPFFTTKAVGKGSGLGLAISHSLVTQMGGTLTAQSTPGRGSCFCLQFPAAPSAQAAAAASVSQSPPAALQSGRILIVDDEVRFGQTLKLLLRGGSREVTYSPSAREALSWLREGRQYDAILCDLMMADMTGRQFYEALCQHSPEQARRVIFMTGGAYTPTSLDFVAKMTNPLLTKPFKQEVVEKLLSALLPPA